MVIEIPKVSIGNFTDTHNITGATVFLFDEPLLCAIDKRGGAQTTRQTDALTPPHISLGVDAIFLSGGSAFGLGAANAVVQFLREQGKGFEVGKAKVPRVPTACIFDLNIGEPVPPSEDGVYKSCKEAKRDINFIEEGSIGAGTGATVGKLFGIKYATKSGTGFAWSEKNGVRNFVFAVVNAFGNIVKDGKIIAGVRKMSKDKEKFFDFIEEGIFHPPSTNLSTGRNLAKPEDYFSSTVLIVGFTEGSFSLPELSILAQCMNSALAHCVKPAHTPFDGDIAFAVSCGEKKTTLFDVFAEFYRLTKKAVISAVEKAKSLGGVPSLQDI